MAKSRAAKLQEVFERASKGFDLSWSASWTTRETAQMARRFVDVAGAQWDGALAEQYANRPMFEINKISRACERVYNEYRANRITVDFLPESGEADDEVADLLDGLYRADEIDSNAQEAYDEAFQSALKGGYGAWRVITEYEDEGDPDNERQRVCIEPIYDAETTVYWPTDALRYDKRDAKWCVVLIPMGKDAYAEAYPDKPMSDYTKPEGDCFSWLDGDLVYIAEYYEVESTTETIVTYRHVVTGETMQVPADQEDQAELEPQGYERVKERKIKRDRVHKYVLNGQEVIEDVGIIAGRYIPIVPVYGKRAVINGVEYVQGMSQIGMDSQRLYNLMVSSIAETAAAAGVSVPIFTADQIAGHEYHWSRANVDRPSFLTVNATYDAQGNPIQVGPLGYTQPPQVSQATAALVDICNRDMADVTGVAEQQQQATPNMSGIAVELTQNQADMFAFGYMDNFAQSMRRCGEIWLSIKSELETEPRTAKVVHPDGSQQDAELMQPMIDPETGGEITRNDLSAGKYKVVVDVGPSFLSKRQSMLRTIGELMTRAVDPADQKLLLSVAMNNIEGEGMQDIRKYYRKQLVQGGVLEPNEEEAKAMQEAQANAQPDPQQQYLMAMAQEAAAKAEQAQATTVKTYADAEQSQAKTAEILAGIDAATIDRVLQLAQMLQQNQQTQAM